MTLYKNRLQGSLGIYTPFMPITMNDAQTTKHYDGWNTLCLQNSLKYFFVGNQSYGMLEKKRPKSYYVQMSRENYAS